MLYSCTWTFSCRLTVASTESQFLSVLSLFYLDADWISRTTVPRSSDILDSGRTCAFRMSCMTAILPMKLILLMIFLFWCANCLRSQAHNFRVWFGTMCKDLSVVGFDPTTSWWFGQKRENLPNRPIDSAVRWVICLSPHLDENIMSPRIYLLTVYCQTIDCRSPVYINHCTSCCTAVPVDL